MIWKTHVWWSVLCLSVQVCQQVLNPVFFMWTWTASLCLWVFDIDQTWKVWPLFCQWMVLICSERNYSLIDPFSSPAWVDALLAGKPVAVTSNRGEGRVPRRAGANPQLEQQYYQRKYAKPQPGEILIPSLFVMELAGLTQCFSFTYLNLL